jgi:hypothetical protein
MAAQAADLANAAKVAPDREAQLSALTQLHDLLLKKVSRPQRLFPLSSLPTERARACGAQERALLVPWLPVALDFAVDREADARRLTAQFIEDAVRADGAGTLAFVCLCGHFSE